MCLSVSWILFSFVFVCLYSVASVRAVKGAKGLIIFLHLGLNSVTSDIIYAWVAVCLTIREVASMWL